MGNHKRTTHTTKNQKCDSGVIMFNKAIDGLAEQGISLKRVSFGNHRTTCPKCSHLRNKKTDPCLSVTIDDEGGAVWNCHHCGWLGNVVGGERIDSAPKERKFRVVREPEERNVTTHIYDWFSKRGLSAATVDHFRIFRSKQSFGGPEKGCIAFPYYDNGKLVNVKYRTHDKSFKQEANAKRTLFNKDSYTSGPIVFVEGEIDVMSLHEAGMIAVSLPDGAPKEAKFNTNDKRFEAMRNCEFIEKLEKIYIGVDTDEAGQALQAELVHRFGKDRCWIIRWPDGCKDANEVLIKYGSPKIVECVENSVPFPVDGVYTTGDYKAEVFDVYHGNYTRPLSTGFPNLDEIYQVMPSTFQVVTGIPNHGKSNFIDQLAVNMAKKHGWKFAIYSPEHSTTQHIRRLTEKIVRKPFDIGPTERMTATELTGAMQFMENKFHFIEADDQIPSIDWLLEKCRAACLRYGVNGVIVDPYNEIDASRGEGKREDEHIRDLISKCKSFCRKHNIVMWMVAHPSKMQRGADGGYPPPSLYDVSGAAHWNNMADVGLVIHRDFDDGTTQVLTRKIREQGLYGSIGEALFRYNLTTHCYDPLLDAVDYATTHWTND